MGKMIDVSTINRKKLSFTVIIYDLIIAAVCLTAILTLAFGNFWKIKVDYILQDEMLREAMSSSGITFDTSSIEEQDRTVHLNLNLSSATMLSSVAGENEAIVTHVIDDQIASLLNQTKPLLKTVTKLVAKVSVASLVEEVKKGLGDEIGDAEQALAEMGLDLNELTGTVDSVIDELFSDAPDTEKVKGELVEVMTKVVDKMNPDDTAQGEEAVNQFTEFYDKIITDSVNESGELDMGLVLNQIMQMAGNSGGNNETPKPAPSEEAPAAFRFAAAPESQPGASGTASTEEGFEVGVRAMIMEQLDDSMISTIGLVARICGIVLLVVIAAWAYVLLKLILKVLFAKNKTVRMSVGCFWGFLLYFILVILPWVAFSFIVPNVMPPDALGPMAGLKIAFASTAVVSFICSLVLFVVWVAGYRRLRKQSKAIVRQEKMTRA